jgi:SAM-dependent methyltransferase
MGGEPSFPGMTDPAPSDHVDRVRDVFENWAARGRAEGMAERHGAFVRPVFERLPLPPDGTYLDIGCGNGYTVRWAAAAMPDGRAVGLDVSPGMIERARELSGDLPNARFHVAAFPDDHPVPAGSCDVIFSMEAFYYLPDLGAGLAEVRRLLRPGGVFACQTDYYEENTASHAWTEDTGVEMTLLGESGWREAFEDQGLEVVDQFRVRLSPEEASEPWHVEEGSLVTLGRRPG